MGQIEDIYLAVMNHLNSDPYLGFVFFTSAPDNKTPPYVVIVPQNEDVESSFTSDHSNLTIEIHIYGTTQPSQMQDIMQLDGYVFNSLNRATIEDSNWAITCNCIGRGVPSFSDGLYVVISTYRIYAATFCESL